MRARASAMSARVGPVRVAKILKFGTRQLEHFFHDLANGRQRIELATLHLVEQPPELGIGLDGAFQMTFRATGCNGEHFCCEVLPSTLLEHSLRIEVRAVRADLVPECG